MAAVECNEKWMKEKFAIAKRNGSVPFNFYFKPCTDILQKMTTTVRVVNNNMTKQLTMKGYFLYKLDLYKSGGEGDILIYVGELK